MERFGSFGELIENTDKPVIFSSHIPVYVSTFTSGLFSSPQQWAFSEDVVRLWYPVTTFIFLGA